MLVKSLKWGGTAAEGNHWLNRTYLAFGELIVRGDEHRSDREGDRKIRSGDLGNRFLGDYSRPRGSGTQ